MKNYEPQELSLLTHPPNYPILILSIAQNNLRLQLFKGCSVIAQPRKIARESSPVERRSNNLAKKCHQKLSCFHQQLKA